MVIRGKHLLWTGLLLIVLAAAGVGLWFILRPTDENRIRDRFARFAECASKNGREGAIPAAARAKEIAELFSEHSTFNVDGLSWMAGPFTRQQLSSNAFRSRALLDRAKLAFSDLEIQVAPDRKSARIFLSASLDGVTRDGREFREVRELECAMVKIGSDWVFDSFKVREIIRK